MATRQNAIPVGLIILALSAGCASPAGGDPTDLPEPLATAAALPEVDPPTTPAVAVATATPTDFMAQPTGTFAAGGMIIPTKTLHPEGYTFEDSDIRSDLRTLRPELNELQAPFATAARGTAEALGRFPSATPWPFPVTPNPTPILDSWIVEDLETQAEALKAYEGLLEYVGSAGNMSVPDFRSGLADIVVDDIERAPGRYCRFAEIVDEFARLKSQGVVVRFQVPRLELRQRANQVPIMLMGLDEWGFYFSVMRVVLKDPLVVETLDLNTGAIVHSETIRAGFDGWYFYPRLEDDQGGPMWRLYAGDVPIGCYP